MTSMLRNVALVLVVASVAPSLAGQSVCAPGPTTLCLNNQRFQVDVQWKDFENRTGAGQAVGLTSDTGYFWFFNNSNVELVVKVLDGRGLNGHFWVFFGALSNVEYTMRVTDTQTGNVATYFNPSGRFASVGDTGALSGDGATTFAKRYATTNEGLAFAEPALARTGTDSDETCTATETSLCLNGGRFRVEATWKDFSGNTGTGKAVALTAETGYFWFFNSTNVELVVKVLDARGLNNRFWVFYGALSNVEYEMTVTDTLTGNVKVYSNPSGRFASTGDTAALAAGYSVAAQGDDSRSVWSEIPTSGGSISATAADGTVFTLTIPPDALLSPETITLTPVPSIDRLPLSGGLGAAVELAPAGLRLFKPATLTITPAAAIPIAEQVTFGWRGNGDEFFLFPPELEASKISMKVMHLGGYGVGRGTSADESAQQQRTPASPEDALSQRLQALLANRRRTQSAGPVIMGNGDPDFIERLNTQLRDYYNNVLKADLEIMKTDCKRAKTIAPRALSWARSVSLLGGDAEFAAEIQSVMDALIDGLVNCYDESFDTCVDENDPAQVREMLSFSRQLALLGAEGRVDATKIERCARFELDYESVIEELEPHGSAFKWSHRVKATVPLAFSFVNGPAGTTDSVYSVTYTGPSVSPCTQTTTGSNSVFQVVETKINLNVFEGGAPPPDALTMEYDPGYPNFNFTMSCPMSPPIVLEQERWRAEYYAHHHSDEAFSAGYLARNWSRVGGGIYARRTYQINTPFATETTIMNLKHTPQ